MEYPTFIIKNLISENGKNNLVCCLNSKILVEYAETWKYNRFINNYKVKDISNMIYSNYVNILNSMIYCYYYNNKLIVYDGNHRLNAIKNCYEKDNININVLCYITIPNEFIDIYNIDSHIYESFKIVNKNTELPDIYLKILENNNNIDMAIIITNVFNDFKRKYKIHYSKAEKPRSPNFNETTFMNLCYSLFEEYTIINEEDLYNILIYINSKYLLNNDLTLKPLKSVNKCHESGLYLFL